MWPFTRKRRRPEKLYQPKTRFLCEQNGSPERSLKVRLRTLFSEYNEVERAYLARVEYDDPNSYEVALCLRSPERPKLAARIGEIFAEDFSVDIHLDVLFLNDVLEAELVEVCRPFFVREEGP
jgi:hypothetical protein